ncbi:hypothetical protein AAKU58_004320 [Oxalobacteraceae bacterium GrIS 1.18]
MKKKDATVGEIPMAFDLTHARHDPAHCLAPGLFRSLKRGDRKKLKLDVTYPYGGFCCNSESKANFWQADSALH